MHNDVNTRVLLAVGSLVLGTFLVTHAIAGFFALPLKAELDVAQTVVVGRITDMTKLKEEHDGKLVWGRATVAVSEVLKGQKADEIMITVLMYVDWEGYGRHAASPLRVRRIGDEGIWVVMPDGRASHAYGLLDKKRLDEVKATLLELDKRVWSEEVAGLKAWAGTADLWDPSHQGVVFAVRNVSKSIVWLPSSLGDGVVTAVARDAGGKQFRLGAGRRVPDEGRVVCRPLQPGQTRYMHPSFGDDYGFIGISSMHPGRYTVAVTLANARDGKAITGTAKTEPVNAWKGKVVAPTFALGIPEPPASKPTTHLSIPPSPDRADTTIRPGG